MHITLRQLEVFAEVHKSGSTTQASQMLALSQSAVSARPGTKCHRERCLVGKVSAVITFSFVCLKVTPRGIKYKIDYMFIINRNKWLMAASPVTTGRERVRQKRGGLAGKTMIL